MVDTGNVNTVKEHVRDAEHIRELFLLDSINGPVHSIRALCGLNLVLQSLYPADEEASSTAGKIP